MGRWLVEGVDLSTYAWNVADRAGGWSVPGRKGGNTDMPNMHGRRYVPNKVFDAGRVSLSMWALGCLPDGTFPTTQTRAWQCRENLQQLAALFSQPGLLEVQRLESAGYGAVNLHPNPGFEAFTLGSTLYRNEVLNPAMAIESSQLAYSNLFPDPEIVISSAWSTIGNNIVPDPAAKRYRTNAVSVIEKNYVGQASFENYSSGAVPGSWFTGAHTTTTVDTTTALVGTHSLKVLATAAVAASESIGGRGFGYPVGSTPYWRFGVRRIGTGTTTRTIGYRLNYIDPTNAIVTAGTWQTATIPTAGAWTEVTIPRSFFTTPETSPATAGQIEFRAGEAWASGEGVFLDKILVGEQPGISGQAGPWWDGDSLWASWTGGIGTSISQFDSVTEADWTVDTKTTAYLAAAVCGNDTTGSTQGFIAFGNTATGTQTFTLPLLTGDVGKYYTLQFTARALSGVTATVDLMYSDSGGPLTSAGSVSVVGSGTAADHNMTGSTTVYFGPSLIANSGRAMYVRVTVPTQTHGNQAFQFTALAVASWPSQNSGDVAPSLNTSFAWEGTAYQSRTIYSKHFLLAGIPNPHSTIAAGTNTMTHNQVEIVGNYPGDIGNLQFNDLTVDATMMDDGVYLAGDFLSSASSGAAGVLRAVVEARDAGGALLSTFTGSNVTTNVNVDGTQVFLTVSVTVTALPTGTSFIRCRVELVGAVYPTIVWGQNLMVLNRSAAVSFFSGSTTDTADHVYSWAGTANASVSQARATYPNSYRAVKGVPLMDSYAGQGMVLWATNKVDGPTIEVAAVLPTGLINVGTKVSADVEANIYAQAVNNGTVLAESFIGIVSPAPFAGGSVQDCQGVVNTPSATTHVRFVARHPDNSVWPYIIPILQVRYSTAYVFSNAGSGNPRQDGNRLLNFQYVRGTTGWTVGTPPTVDVTGLVQSSSVAFGTELKATGKQTVTNLGHIPCVAGDTVFGWVKARASKNWNLQLSWYTAAGVLLSTSTIGSNSTAGTQTVSGTGIAPATTGYALFRVQLAVVPTGADTLEIFRSYATQVAASRDYSTALDPTLWRYVDGTSKIDWLGRTVTWEGVANASRTAVASAVPSGWDTVVNASQQPQLRPPGSTGRAATLPSTSATFVLSRTNHCPNPEPASTTGWAGSAALTIVSAPWDSNRTAMRAAAADSNVQKVGNPGFEVDLTGWTESDPNNILTLSRSTAVVRTGVGSLRMDWTGGGAGQTAQAQYTVTGLAVGRSYNVSVWVFCPTGSSGINPILIAGATTSASTAVTANTWTQRTLTFLATATTQLLGVQNFNATSAGQIVYVDDLSVIIAPTVVFTFSQQAAPAFSAGETITVRAKVKASSPTRGYYLSIHQRSPNAYLAPGSATPGAFVADGVGNPGWVELVITAVLAADVAAGQLDAAVLTLGNGIFAESGETLTVGDIYIGRADSGAYFDGDVTDTATTRYDWTGTAGSSSSTMSTGVGTTTPVLSHPVAVAGVYTSGEIALARRDTDAGVTVKVMGYDSEARANPLVLATVASTTVSGIVSWNDVDLQGKTWLGVEVDYIEIASAPSGIAVVMDDLLLTAHDPIWAADYPGYFDGSRSGAVWNGTANASSSTNYAGGLEAFAERLTPIDMTAMAGGTRAEFTVDLEIPAAFWQDLAVRTFTTTITGVPTTVDLTDFAGTTAPIEDAVITITSTSGSAPATSITLTDVLSGAWLAYNEQIPAGGVVRIDCAALAVTLNTTTTKIRKVTRGGPARFLTLNAPGYNLPPQLTISGAGAFDGILTLTVTGRRKFFIT
jgi:hypothetical protein